MKYPLLLPCCLALASAQAQMTHTVGPGGFPSIDAAIAAASPGDIVLVQGGGHAGFTLSKALTIRGLGGAHVLGTSIVQLPARESAHLVSLHVDGLHLRAGRLTLDECDFTPFAAVPRIVVDHAELHLQGCGFLAPAVAVGLGNEATISATAAAVTMVDTLVGGHGASYLAAAGPAIRLAGSTLYASHGQLRGGVSTYLLPQHAAAVVGDAASTIWIADAAVHSLLAAVCPLQVAGRCDRCVLTAPCPSLQAGLVLGVQRTAPLQNGAPFALVFSTTPQTAVGVFVSLSLGTSHVIELEQALLLPLGSAFAAGLMLADAAGRTQTSWQIPSGAWFVDRALWFQAFSGTVMPLQASPPVGGVVR